jgi:quercetin dioxygenase-like cupin family protein
MSNNEFEKGVVFNYSDKIEYANEAVVSKHVLKKETGNVSLFAFDKGEALSEHTAPFDALVYIVDGQADILIDGKSNIMQKGDSIIMPANIPHAVKADEKFKMLLTMIKK